MEQAPITALKTLRSSIGSHRGDRIEPTVGQAQARPPPSQLRGKHHPMRMPLGPNAAWTGVNTPPPITPMSGKFISSVIKSPLRAAPTSMVQSLILVLGSNWNSTNLE